jgi:AcrR family transcriptional regulator
MPRQIAENQRIRDERQEQILRAAAHVFARKGLAATKITDIATEAGMSHGLMYHYFSSKEEIFRSLVSRAMQGIGHILHEACTREETPTERLRWLIRELIEGAKDGQDDNLIVQQAMISESVPPDVHALVLREPPKFQAMLSGLLREGQASGEFIAGDADQLAFYFFSCIQGVVADRALFTEQADPEPDLLLRLFQAR